MSLVINCFQREPYLQSTIIKWKTTGNDSSHAIMYTASTNCESRHANEGNEKISYYFKHKSADIA